MPRLPVWLPSSSLLGSNTKYVRLPTETRPVAESCNIGKIIPDFGGFVQLTASMGACSGLLADGPLRFTDSGDSPACLVRTRLCCALGDPMTGVCPTRCLRMDGWEDSVKTQAGVE